jgi:hypothetical protein
MPANIAHMLICNKAVKVLQNGGRKQSISGKPGKKFLPGLCVAVQ